MGYYIDIPTHQFGKSQYLCRNYDASVLKMSPDVIKAWEPLEKVIDDPRRMLICVVENEYFDAAMIVYDGRELERIRNSIENGDSRKMTWLVMDPLVVKKLNVHVPMID